MAEIIIEKSLGIEDASAPYLEFLTAAGSVCTLASGATDALAVIDNAHKVRLEVRQGSGEVRVSDSVTNAPAIGMYTSAGLSGILASGATDALAVFGAQHNVLFEVRQDGRILVSGADLMALISQLQSQVDEISRRLR